MRSGPEPSVRCSVRSRLLFPGSSDTKRRPSSIEAPLALAASPDTRALPIEHTHALAVAALEPLHRDPFDRLLVAQAGLLDVPILTADPLLARYPVQALLI